MDWEISFSNKADKYLKRHRLPDSFATDLVVKAIRKISGEIIALDLRRTTGEWAGCYRVRVGKTRVIFSANFETRTALIEVVDNRDKAYK